MNFIGHRFLQSIENSQSSIDNDDDDDDDWGGDKDDTFLCEKGKNNRLWYPGFMTADI